MSDFSVAYAKTMKSEGGYSNDPTDRGGETYKGIARKIHPTWAGWPIIDGVRNQPGFPKNIPATIEPLVQDFYRVNFWQAAGCDACPQDVAEEVFDTAVNQGVGTAAKYLQEALNVLNRNGQDYADIPVDGGFGKGSRTALTAFLAKNKSALLLKVLNILQGAKYIDIMRKDPTQEKFARGWLERVSI